MISHLRTAGAVLGGFIIGLLLIAIVVLASGLSTNPHSFVWEARNN